jgi:hypothetical protein
VSTQIVIAPSIEQGEILAERLGLRPRPRIITTGRPGIGLRDGSYPLPDDVHYAPGWERGPLADKILRQLRRAYAKRLPSERPA